MLNQKLITQIIIGVILYFLSTGLSFAGFSLLGGKETTTVSPLAKADKQSGFKVDLTAPKTEICPLNGGMFTKAEKDIWSARRPIAAMIENHAESRPPSGLSRADIVYEAVAEGGITRYMGLFYCGASAKAMTIAPVRSSRIYFITWAQEYGDKPIYMHVGGANNICPTCPAGVKPSGTVSPKVMAIEYLADLGWRTALGNDFDTTFDLGAPVFIRNPDRLDHQVATEHTMMAFLDEAWKTAEKRSLGAKDAKGVSWDKNFVSWKFTEDNPVKTGAVTDIKFGFWDKTPDYDVEWKYNSLSNNYLRFDGGKPHVDLEENNSQMTAKNVVVMYVKEQDMVDEEGHTFIKSVGNGDAIIFQNGKAVTGTWQKETAGARTKFFDEKGLEISFVRGIIWIEAVPDYSKAIY